MKTLKAAFRVGLLTLAGGLPGPIQVCRAQILVGGVTNQTAAPLASVPSTGTFFSAQLNLPPWPMDWLPQLPVYSYGSFSNVFIIDDRSWDYGSSGVSKGAATARIGGMGAMVSGGPPPPPVGGWTSNSGGGGGSNMALPAYTEYDLYLTNFVVTNILTNCMVIHPPSGVTNGVYDLYYTTNLAPPISWHWLMTTTPGQTKLTVTNATDPQRFYVLDGTNSSAGADFWFAFMDNQQTGAYMVYISSQVTNTGTVSNPNPYFGTTFTSNFTLMPRTATNISIPYGEPIYGYDLTNNMLGDPCEILLPPTGHYLTAYTIAIPPNDGQNGTFDHNFLNLILPQSATLTTMMDGTNISTNNFVPIGSSGYSGARVSVDPATTHTISSSQPVEVQVYGFTDNAFGRGGYDAYGYIGGVTSFP